MFRYIWPVHVHLKMDCGLSQKAIAKKMIFAYSCNSLIKLTWKMLSNTCKTFWGYFNALELDIGLKFSVQQRENDVEELLTNPINSIKPTWLGCLGCQQAVGHPNTQSFFAVKIPLLNLPCYLISRVNIIKKLVWGFSLPTTERHTFQGNHFQKSILISANRRQQVVIIQGLVFSVFFPTTQPNSC